MSRKDSPLRDEILRRVALGQTGTCAQWVGLLPTYSRQGVWQALERLAREGYLLTKILSHQPKSVLYYGNKKRPKSDAYSPPQSARA